MQNNKEKKNWRKPELTVLAITDTNANPSGAVSDGGFGYTS